MAIEFGAGAWPEGLRAEVDARNLVVNISCDDAEREGQSKYLCQIPVSSFLLVREQIADELLPHLKDMVARGKELRLGTQGE